MKRRWSAHSGLASLWLSKKEIEAITREIVGPQITLIKHMEQHEKLRQKKKRTKKTSRNRTQGKAKSKKRKTSCGSHKKILSRKTKGEGK